MSRIGQHFFELQQQHLEDEMPTRHAHLPDTMAMILNSMCPAPIDDGQQQAQAEPWLSPVEHLQVGGYHYEARVLSEVIQALRYVLDCIERNDTSDMQPVRDALAKATGDQA